MKVITSITIDINMTDAFDRMEPTQQWDFLQYVWDKMLRTGMEGDWDSFHQENNIMRSNG